MSNHEFYCNKETAHDNGNLCGCEVAQYGNEQYQEGLKKSDGVAFAVVYKKSLPELDGEARKGVVVSIHLTKRVAEMYRDKTKHTIKKISYRFVI